MSGYITIITPLPRPCPLQGPADGPMAHGGGGGPHFVGGPPLPRARRQPSATAAAMALMVRGPSAPHLRPRGRPQALDKVGFDNNTCSLYKCSGNVASSTFHGSLFP